MISTRRLLPTAVAVSLASLSLAAIGCSGNALSSRSASRASELSEVKQRIIALERQQAMLTVELRHLRDELAGQSGVSGVATSRDQHPRSDMEGTGASSKDVAGGKGMSGEGIEESALPSAPQTKREPASPQQPVSSSPEAPPAPASPVESSRASSPVPATGQALYDRGYTQYHQGHYGKTDLGDNALYWIGESRYSLGEYKSALTAFKQTVERYPSGNKVPDALLKAGQCFERLGDAKSAKTTYEEIVRRFAGTTAATLASERLHALR